MRKVCVALLVSSGCAGALGIYVPGSGNKSGDWQAMTPVGGGMGKVTNMHYEIGDRGFGLGLGAKMGTAMSASVGGESVDGGLAGEFHTDFGYGTERFGGQLTVAFGADRGTKSDMTEVSFGGLSVGLIGQAAIINRIATHVGVSRLVKSSVSVGDESVSAGGWRLAAGFDLTFYRGEKNEFVFRPEVRFTRSGDAAMGMTDVGWTSTALLGEIAWISTP